MKNFNLSAVLLCLLFAIACKNDEDVVKPDKDLNICLLTNITFAGTDAITYEYDNQKRLKKANHAKDAVSNENYYKEYDYDAANRVIKESFKLSDGTLFSYFAFTYNNKNLLEKIAFYTKSAGNSFKHEYDKILIYSGTNKIEQVKSLNPDDPATDYRVAEYTYDAKQNISKVQEFVVNGTSKLNDLTTEYTYDNQNNPYLNATYLGIGAETISRNNIATEKETYHLSGLTKNYTYTYQYNARGLPTKQIRQSDTNTLEILREYACTE
ncbi:hypothetical protein [Adhaeribacter rhizoryzae]|uniref:DUF4595 domain-containing protein n=1 Tax=Adhaeribacter rhizoryzae TaxID=2607907 RepID=A0A5M6D8X5_9BACT|nr:hypothetical protein [Adhaeribacter rhizoryzae]KAA5542930.1 hypothetical protein F0145_17470 [Adhaeribacter rhizoryzae]